VVGCFATSVVPSKFPSTYYQVFRELPMVLSLQVLPAGTLRRIQRIQLFTILWMSAEAGVALSAAWMARSPALLAFGGDSAIELFSAAVVLWRFRRGGTLDEQRAANIAGGLLYLLAVYVVVTSTFALFGYIETRPTYVGIALLAAAAAIMPWLAREKRQLSAATNSATLRADAAESALCGYLAFIALVGLVARAIWGVSWADPVAALLAAPLIIKEGREAMRGRACGCC
jgi:divalent metal cation (Fe/Co/Zn/Cd) transporter